MAYNFQTNKTYSFDVHAPAILSSDFKNVVVLGILSYHAALTFSDIHPIQVNVYPHLPPGTPNRPEEYDYLLLRTSTGVQTVLARQWINESTVVSVGNSKAVVTIEEVGSEDIENIRAALAQNGFDKFEIRIVS